MRKITILVVLFATLSSYSQYDKSNEIRLNAFGMIAARTLDISYEHYFNEESAVGASFAFSLADKYNLFEIKQDYAITPYYRYYFPNHVAPGMFLEAFLSANAGYNKEEYSDLSNEILDLIDDEDEHIDENDNDLLDDGDYIGLKYSDFAFGIGGGYKYASEGGFVGELYAGVGRNLSGDEKVPTVFPRLGVSFGFRF